MKSITQMVTVFTPPNTAGTIESLCRVERLAWSSPGENIEADPKKISLRLESFSEGVSLAMIGKIPAGSQYSFLFDWDGNPSHFTTWDEVTHEGWTNKVHVNGGNTGFLVGVGVVPEFRRQTFMSNICGEEKRISDLLIINTLRKLFAAGVEQVAACARIPLFHTKPELSVFEYCALKREDGKLYDPVLRFHQHLGAALIKPVAYAMEDAESLNGGCFVLYKP